MKVLIIEDEEQSVSALRSEIAMHCKNLQIIGVAKSVNEAIEKIDTLQPELVFLDIQLSDGLGFEILDYFKQRLFFQVIFTTAYSQYAIRAIKFSALDYLLKPIDAEELVIAVNKAQKISKKDATAKIENLLYNQSQSPVRKKIVLPTLEGITVFEVASIMKCSAEGNYTSIYFTNGKKMLFSKTLKEFEELLCHSGFERIHNSHIINLDHLVSFVNKDGGYVILSDKSTLPVSQRKKANLLAALGNLS